MRIFWLFPPLAEFSDSCGAEFEENHFLGGDLIFVVAHLFFFDNVFF